MVVRKQLGIVNAYTMEASFMGADRVRMDKQRKGCRGTLVTLSHA